MPLPTVPTHHPRILCIDDNVDLLECLQSFLETFGYTVQVTTSAMKAIQLAAQWKADAVIVDYNMPEMDGEQVAREIRKIRSHVAIIMLSGALDVPEETLKLVDAFVDKNHLASHLLPAISDLLCQVPIPPHTSNLVDTDDYPSYGSEARPGSFAESSC